MFYHNWNWNETKIEIDALLKLKLEYIVIWIEIWIDICLQGLHLHAGTVNVPVVIANSNDHKLWHTVLGGPEISAPALWVWSDLSILGSKVSRTCVSHKIYISLYNWTLIVWYTANIPALRCTALYCAALHCTALHYSTLHCTALLWERALLGR